MKYLFDLLPIAMFFVTFRLAEADKAWAAGFATRHFGSLVSGGKVGTAEAPVLLATVVVIVATLAQILWLKARKLPVKPTLWISFGLVAVLGGLTIWLHDENFIKWKPTVLYWVFASALALSPLVLGKNLVKRLMGEQMSLPEPIWRQLNVLWAVFFAAMGLLNLWVAYHFETATWVNFKLFGATGLLVAFMLAQGLYLNRHLLEVPATPPAAPPSPEAEQP